MIQRLWVGFSLGAVLFSNDDVIEREMLLLPYFLLHIIDIIIIIITSVNVSPKGEMNKTFAGNGPIKKEALISLVPDFRFKR